MKSKTRKLGGSSTKFAYALLSPSLILLVLLIGYPLVYNVVISFQDVPLNPNLPSTFVGVQNFVDVFTDASFYHSVLITLLFTVIVTVISTVLGLLLAVFLNRKFFGKKIVNSIIILSYVVPAVCLIFTWRYMFNNIYGIMNYVVVDLLKLTDEAPLWFDQPTFAFIGNSSRTHISLLTRFSSLWTTAYTRLRTSTGQAPGKSSRRSHTLRSSLLW